VLIGDPVHDAGSARELDHLLAVPAAQRIIEVEHDLGLVVLRRILRGLKARGSALLLSTGPPGVVDHRLDPEHVAHPDDRVGDLAPPWVTLALHMETALARKDQGPQLFAGDGQLRREMANCDRKHVGVTDRVLPAVGVSGLWGKCPPKSPEQRPICVT
jgi:hypothetical protein